MLSFSCQLGQCLPQSEFLFLVVVHFQFLCKVGPDANASLRLQMNIGTSWDPDREGRPCLAYLRASAILEILPVDLVWSHDLSID
jgi:hypothetical protein